MELSVRYMLELRDIAGLKEETLVIDNDSSVLDLLGTLFSRYPAIQTVLVDKRTEPSAPRVTVLVNGRNVKFLNGLQTPLSPGDLVCVQPATR